MVIIRSALIGLYRFGTISLNNILNRQTIEFAILSLLALKARYFAAVLILGRTSKAIVAKQSIISNSDIRKILHRHEPRSQVSSVQIKRRLIRILRKREHRECYLFMSHKMIKLHGLIIQKAINLLAGITVNTDEAAILGRFSSATWVIKALISASGIREYRFSGVDAKRQMVATYECFVEVLRIQEAYMNTHIDTGWSPHESTANKHTLRHQQRRLKVRRISKLFSHPIALSIVNNDIARSYYQRRNLITNIRIATSSLRLQIYLQNVSVLMAIEKNLKKGVYLRCIRVLTKYIA